MRIAISYLKIIENVIGIKKKNIKFKVKQKGDTFKTHGSNKNIIKKTGYSPRTSIKTGIKKFVEWYREYYKNFL